MPSYSAYSAYADYYYDQYNSAIGFMALGDRSADGGITKTHIALSYMYRLPIGRAAFLRMALQPALVFASYSPDRIVFPDQIDPEGNISGGGGGASSKPYFDLALGTIFTYKRFYAGLALHHIASVNTLKVGDASIASVPKITFNAGYNIEVMLYQNSPSLTRLGGYALRLSPNILVTQQYPSNFYSIGTFAALTNYAVGLHYKSSVGNSAHFCVISAHYSGKMIGVAYHFEFGWLNRTIKPVPVNAHEVSVCFKMGRTSAVPRRINIYDEKTYDIPDF